MTDLTPELKAAGWKPISEIVNEPDDGIYQSGKVDKLDSSNFKRFKEIFSKGQIAGDIGLCSNAIWVFRRLIPVTQDTIVLSREDAKEVTDCLDYGAEHVPNHFGTFEDLARKIRQQLGGSDV